MRTSVLSGLYLQESERKNRGGRRFLLENMENIELDTALINN